MIVVDNVIISDDIKEVLFVCNLEKCKGSCCVEGDLGAPLEKEELVFLEDNYEIIKTNLSKDGIDAIEKQGKYVLDEEGDYSTTTVGGAECAYAIYENGILKCGIEKTWKQGKINFKKPISCHLYPIRLTKHDEFIALNYDKWDICNSACKFGTNLNVPLYKFLEKALIRKFGFSWYQKLLLSIKSLETE